VDTFSGCALPVVVVLTWPLAAGSLAQLGVGAGDKYWEKSLAVGWFPAVTMANPVDAISLPGGVVEVLSLPSRFSPYQGEIPNPVDFVVAASWDLSLP
jgi:hypothetical protein